MHETLSLVGKERITVLYGVPTQMVMMVGADLSKYDLSTLRCGFFGGQTLADDVTRKVMALFPEYFGNVYGSTEALMVTCCDYRKHPEQARQRRQGLGQHGSARHPHRQPRPDDLCKPGEIGQLITRGPSLLTEYFGLPDRTAAAFTKGWFCRATPRCSTTKASSP